MSSTLKPNKKSAVEKTMASSLNSENPVFGFEIFDSLPDMYFMLDVKGEIMNLNSKADNFIKANNNLPPTNFLDLIDIYNREEVNNIFFQCISFGKDATIESRFLVGQKEIDVNISFSFHELIIDGDRKSYVFVVVKDIMEIKAKEAELQRFFNIVETSLNPIQITDLNGNITYVNPAFVKASGYRKKELIGQNPRIFGSGKMPKKFWDKMWQAISSGKVWFGEIENRKKNEEPFYTQLLISPIFDKDEKITGYFGIHRDLSDKRTLEKQLIHTQKMESIGTLAAGIAHEVGNPLASISALVQVAQRSTDEPF